MNNIEIIVDKDGIEHILIDRGNKEFTSMLKSVYDEQQAAQTNQPILSPLAMDAAQR